MSTPKLLAATDSKMIDNLTIISYFEYIIKTVLGKGYGDRVKSK
jgi:O-antigen biosynthesis protein WbqP